MLVVAPDGAVARWAAKPIDTGHVAFVPIVVGPEAIPPITDAAEAERAPELALLSLRAHRDGPLAVAVASAAVESIEHAEDPDAAAYYRDLILHWLVPDARIKLEEIMNLMNRQPRSEWGKEWYGKGRAEGRADLVLRQLELKFGPLDDATRSRVVQAEPDQLDRWAEQLLEAKTLDDALR